MTVVACVKAVAMMRMVRFWVYFLVGLDVKFEKKGVVRDGTRILD